ncbi:hypothetical protein ACFQ3Z_46265 [Streptomyces nogalater]
MSDTPTPDFSGLEGGDEQQAEDAVQEVVNWYNAQITKERRAPLPDEDRIEELKAVRPRSPTRRSWRPPARRRPGGSPPSTRLG